ncbi:MAG: hypothetical protein KDA27_18710 [Candidatus Eisenbacteria bacterium]|uniref:Uncharacterized protein n=1 Tax=Eiseniibacteriota bacterium TaxID=2212470 RepID=A0A956NIP3_UNCEI|nr:hypothetical protein [Candidatus Eisenbacteria bacterium]
MDTWLAREARRESRRPILEESILFGRTWRYLIYRLRIAGAARLLSWGVHLVEYLFLVQVFTSSNLALSLFVRNAILLGGSFWWGALEVLRSRLRSAPPAPEDRVEIERWLTMASLLGVLCTLAASFCFVVVPLVSSRSMRVVDVYAFVSAFRLALDLIVRTFHSGVYARRRIYRPIGVVLGLELVGLVTVLVTWNHFGRWSFPVALALTTITSRFVILHFSRLGYRSLRIPTPRLGRLRTPSLTPAEARTMLAAGLSSSVSRIGSALVLLLLLGRTGSVTNIVAILHLLAPWIATAGLWPQVFYPDFKRLQEPMAERMRWRLESALERASIYIGVSLAIFGVGAILAMGAAPTLELLAVAPLILVQSIVGQLYLQSFAQERYAPLITGGAVVVAGVPLGLVVYPSGHDIPVLHALVGTTSLSWIAGAIIYFWPRSRTRPSRPEECTYSWLTSLAAVSGPVRVRGIRVSRVASRLRQTLVEELQSRLGEGGLVTVHQDRLLWYERPATHALRRDELLTIACGFVESVDAMREYSSGTVAASTFVPGNPASVFRLVRRFLREVSEGWVIDLTSHRPPPRFDELDPSERQEIWLRARLFALGIRSRTRGRFEVLALRTDGAIRAILLLPRDADLEVRRRWAELARQSNLGDAARSPYPARTTAPVPKRFRRYSRKSWSAGSVR